MKKILLLSLLALFYSAAANAQMLITNGAQLITTGNIQVVLSDMDLDMQGTLDATGSAFYFTGTGNNTINGSGANITFSKLKINKTTGKQLLLNRAIWINDSLEFISGNIELNSLAINLGSTGLFIGESETSHVTGANGGAIHANAVLNAPNAINIGNLGAIISSSQNLGTVYINRMHTSTNIAAAGGKSIYRKFDVVPGGSSIDGILTFKYLDAELNGINENNLTIYKTADDINYTDISFSAHNAVTNTITQTGLLNINGTYTLSSVSGSLPVTLIDFNAQCKGDYIQLNWRTASEQNSDRFDIQRSTNGTAWVKIGAVKSAGNSSVITNYQYDDKTLNAASGFYRLAQYDLDGKLTYSNVVKAGCGQSTEFKVFPNPVQNIAQVTIGSSTSGKGTLLLFNATGQQVIQQAISISKGVNQYQVNTSNLSKGIYNLVLQQNGITIQSTKIIKQ